MHEIILIIPVLSSATLSQKYYLIAFTPFVMEHISLFDLD